ncbi:MAG: phosphoribosylformylglycinamidine synthase subunit PurS, partial [Chloroflexi bacterium]|nr:phosphoribosylformylglycinamidine synthase subunit PurS [Chloroflexota bacterium]
MHRVEVCLKPHLPDARGLGLVRDIHDLGITTVSSVRVVDIYWLDAGLPLDKLDLICRCLLADPVTQDYQCFTPSTDIKGAVNKQSPIIEVTYNAGVTDPVEDTIMKAVLDLGVDGVRAVKTAKRYLLQGQVDDEQIETICNRLLVNPIIQHIVDRELFS